MWTPIGVQPEIPAPGQNEKKVKHTAAYDYTTGKITYTLVETKAVSTLLAFLDCAGHNAYVEPRKVRLVCDPGSFHCTKRSKPGWTPTATKFEIFWLPPYLSESEFYSRTPMGHLKRTVLANIICSKTWTIWSPRFSVASEKINGHREKMAFIFDHDDVLKENVDETFAFLLCSRQFHFLHDTYLNRARSIISDG